MSAGNSGVPASTSVADACDINKVADGYNLVTYSILLICVSGTFAIFVYSGDTSLPDAIGNIAIALGTIAAGTMALIGLLRVIFGMGFVLSVRTLLVVTMFIPLLNLVMLLWLYHRVDRALKASGYRATFLGVSRIRTRP